MKTKDIQDLSTFNDRCQDFMNGKYILADIKVKAILRSIMESELLTLVINRCSNNYDFNTNFKIAVGENFGESASITLPDKTRERVALLFNILRLIDEEVISFYDFVNKYIRKGNEVGNDDFNAFALYIVQPFRDALLTIVQTDFNDGTDVSKEKCFTTLAEKAIEIEKEVEEYRLSNLAKEDLSVLLKALAKSATDSNEEMIYALLVAIEYFGYVNKKYRDIHLILKEYLN